MRLATLKDGTPDGALILVSADGSRFQPAVAAPTLQSAIEHWSETAPRLADEARALDATSAGRPISDAALLAPLPRAWQFLDGSAFTSHAELMTIVFGLSPGDAKQPLMYQGLSDHFLSATDDVPLPDENDGIDFEGEFGVIVDTVPMGVSPADAIQHIKLVVQLNDWSLRALGPAEMKTGFGFIQAKPASSMAPFAVTPDHLGGAWQDCRVHLALEVRLNGRVFGAPLGGAMAFGFHELVAHAARSRVLVAGTVIGSGTVSNANYREIGSTCIAERRAIEILDEGAPRTPFLRFGDRVQMAASTLPGATPFGVINQLVSRAKT